ncbi:hypothetical protein D3C87_1888380 [compost metagenome]
MTRLISAASPISSSVRGSRRAISAETELSSTMERPRSKEARPFSFSTYCSTIGRFSPRSSRIICTVAGSAEPPSCDRSSSTGSPGTKWMDMKTSVTITHNMIRLANPRLRNQNI